MVNAKYSTREIQIFAWVVLPYSFVICLLVFGSCFFSGVGVILKSISMAVLYFAVVYSTFGLVAALVKKRYPDDQYLFRRIATMLPLFYVMNIVMVQGLYLLFNQFHPAQCRPDKSMEWWVTLFACLASTVLTFMNEASAGWDKWKLSIIETEQLKYSYQKTRLLGLKGQVNPHFLFNCFNSLSSLINEDQASAEKFLDEMTKVHRYMLRGDDDKMTTLEQEIIFAASYLHLIKERFGDSIQTEISIQQECKDLLLAPLSMQVILENIIYNNAATRKQPLHILIKCTEGYLHISHTVQAKAGTKNADEEEGLDNLINKYLLLDNAEIKISEEGNVRDIYLPLLIKSDRLQ